MAITIEHPPTESSEERAARYERALKAIGESTLPGVQFGDWAQAVVEDVLEGFEAECPLCETAVHDGPCVGEEETPEQAEAEPPAGGAVSNT